MPGWGVVSVLLFGPMNVISDTRQTPMMSELGFPRWGVTDNLCDTNENACDQETFRGHMGPLAGVTFKWRDYTTDYSAAQVGHSDQWSANPAFIV